MKNKIYTYTLTQNDKVYKSYALQTLTITNTITNETRSCDDFTYFEEDYEINDDVLEELFEEM